MSYIPAVDGCVIMRNTYYNPANLAEAADWARSKIAAGKYLSTWEIRYLQSEIKRIELALSTGRAA